MLESPHLPHAWFALSRSASLLLAMWMTTGCGSSDSDSPPSVAPDDAAVVDGSEESEIEAATVDGSEVNEIEVSETDLSFEVVCAPCLGMAYSPHPVTITNKTSVTQTVSLTWQQAAGKAFALLRDERYSQYFKKMGLELEGGKSESIGLGFADCGENGSFEGTIAVTANDMPAGSIHVKGTTRVPVVDIKAPAGTVELGNVGDLANAIKIPITHDLGAEVRLYSMIHDLDEIYDHNCGAYMNSIYLDPSGTGSAEIGVLMGVNFTGYCSKSGTAHITKPSCEELIIPVEVTLD